MRRLVFVAAVLCLCSCGGNPSPDIESINSVDGGSSAAQSCQVCPDSCDSDSYCEAAAPNACAANASGTCVPVPRFCPEIYKPECGCDGRTYGNNCDRRAARAQLAHDGKCAAPK